MKEKINKNDFLELVGKEIERRDNLVAFVESQVLEIVQQYDGKEFNKEFIRVLRTVASEVGATIQQEPLIQGMLQIELLDIPSQLSTSVSRKLFFKISVDDSNKIIAEKTMGISYNKDSVEEWNDDTNELWIALSMYDEFVDELNELDQKIESARAIPRVVRNNINSSLLGLL